MFKWFKNKINNKIRKEMDECIHQNLKFVEYYKKQGLEPDVELDEVINDIYQRTLNIKKIKKSSPVLEQVYIDNLLAFNKSCRNFWSQWLEKKPLDFDKFFHSKNS